MVSGGVIYDAAMIPDKRMLFSLSGRGNSHEGDNIHSFQKKGEGESKKLSVRKHARKKVWI